MGEERAKKSERHPEALKPLYLTPSPNTTISLFEGDLELHLASGRSLSASGTVEWRWLPSVSIRFTLSGLDHYPNHSDLSEAKLEIPELSLTCGVSITNMGIGQEGVYYGGLLKTPVLVGEDSGCDRVIFHIPNFHSFIGETIRDKGPARWTGRLRLENDNWVIALDGGITVSELIKGLKGQGGYAFTHTGELRHADGEHFRLSEADDILHAVYYFLSFVRGLWCGPVLASGRMGGIEIWQEWATSRLTPWKYVESWFPQVGPKENLAELNQAFRGYMRKWEDSLWKDPIKHSIHWYVESNIGAGGVEGAIVLIQAALELLSWLYFVEDSTTAQYSVTKFGNMNAATKVRDLLSAASIPVDIPVHLKNLRNETAALQASDGPGAFVKLRNAIVHPKKSKRSVVLQTSVLARMEARELGLWYLEMMLLQIFGYEGEYYQRYVSGWPDEVRAKVPWA
jgi:hypothetical protein